MQGERRMASGSGRARMPGQVMGAGHVSSQAAPSFPSQLTTRVGQLTPCPGRQEKKTLPCNEATGRGAAPTTQLVPMNRVLPPQTQTQTPPAALHHTCSSGSGLRHASSRLAMQRKVQALLYPALPSPLPSAQATLDHGILS